MSQTSAVRNVMSLALVALAATACEGVVPSEAEGDEVETATAAATSPGTALFVVGSTTLSAADTAIKNRLTALGFTVVVKAAAIANTPDATGKTLVVISESVTASQMGTKFRTVSTGVMCLDAGLFPNMALTRGTSNLDFGETTGQTELKVLSVSHPLAAGLVVTATSSAQTFGWGLPASGAIKIASLANSSSKMAIFGYDRNQQMVGIKATGRRVGWFAGKTTPTVLTKTGWSLFDAAARWTSEVPPAALAILPGTASFATTIDTTSPSQSFRIHNTGGSPSGAPSVALTGSTTFSIVHNTCLGTLGPNASCNVDVTFHPTAVGSVAGQLTVTASPGGTVVAQLAGNGLAPAQLTVDPTSADFADVAVNSSSAPRNFTVRNTGGSPTGALTVQLAGNNPGDFPIQTNSCTGVDLAAGASCTINLTFAPASLGNKSASLVLSAPSVDPVSVALSGNGVAQATLVLSPAQASFGEVPVGDGSLPIVFTVTNTGGVRSGPTTVFKQGANPGEFRVVSDQCAATGGIAPGGSCSLNVVFEPTSGGERSAILGVTASPGAFATATLSGTGL